VKASQYNHLCQVFGTTLFASFEVINSLYLQRALHFANFFLVNNLPFIIAVDISVDKRRFLLQAIVLSNSY
jgi:hypothetical protein